MLSEDLIKSLVGMTEDAATKAVNYPYVVLITRRDDEAFMSDMMMNENRVKLEIEKGLVIKAAIG